VLLLLALAACTPRMAPPPASPVSSQVGEAAGGETESPEQALFGALTLAYARADAPEASRILSEFEATFPESSARSILRDWRDALGRMGRPAPPLEGVAWMGEVGALDQYPATILAFFEPWCPHCKNDVPQVELLRREYETRGLGVIGVTALSRGATEADLAAFVAAGDLHFPIAKEDGTLSEAYGVSGVPHLVFVREGTVVWAGHPSMVTLDLVGAIADGGPLPLPRPQPEVSPGPPREP
jgi:thiol-disulfide isomerase/thioredoxin